MDSDVVIPGLPPELSLPEAESRNPLYTAERLISDRPSLAELIVRMYREGASISAISRGTKVSRNAITALVHRATEATGVEQGKAADASGWRGLARRCRDRMVEMVDDPSSKLSLRDLTIAAGVAADKAAAAAGDATIRIDVRVEQVDHREFERRIVEMVAQAPHTGLGGETWEAKGAMDGDPAGAGNTARATAPAAASLQHGPAGDGPTSRGGCHASE